MAEAWRPHAVVRPRLVRLLRDVAHNVDMALCSRCERRPYTSVVAVHHYGDKPPVSKACALSALEVANSRSLRLQGSRPRHRTTRTRVVDVNLPELRAS